ncbi:MAG: ABC transporter ATP-binding protein [Lachnospiraceae bacterium]|jgi:ABC-type dipeptide/oligopeptide/nickel transport system ATPase component|nr:ABC transporter ATP-binding protein [Lachnospiraceae bacterium]
MLTVKDLCIKVHDRKTTDTLVYDVDLSMDKGDILGIVGESGSGKTMTALAIAGLLSRHDMEKSGQIIFEGINLLEVERKVLRKIQGNEITMVFQEPLNSFNPLKKVGWQVEEGLRVHTVMDKIEMKDRAIEALRDVELSNPEAVYNSYPHELSGGMRQRAMIAAAMIIQPKLIIADEPTTALDVTIQAEIVELLKRINKERGTAILFISHDLSLVNTLCENVLVMQNGLVVESGKCDSIFNNPKEDYTKKLISAIPKNPFYKG